MMGNSGAGRVASSSMIVLALGSEEMNISTFGSLLQRRGARKIPDPSMERIATAARIRMMCFDFMVGSSKNLSAICERFFVIKTV
jgi:hypothetical protein